MERKPGRFVGCTKVLRDSLVIIIWDHTLYKPFRRKANPPAVLSGSPHFQEYPAMTPTTSNLHVSFDRDPLILPTPSSPHVLVIGAGIIGMSTAWTLLDSGCNVTILSEQYADRDGPRLTSQIAGALWEFPPAVCGHTTNMKTVEVTKRWAMASYHVFRHLASDPVLSDDFKVRMVDTHFFFKKPVVEDPAQLQKMQEIARSGVAGFRHDKRIIHSHGLDEDTWIDAYQLSSPVVDTDAALMRITELVKAKGAKMETRSIEGNLRAQEATLLRQYSAHAIVNASGLGSHELAGDRDVYPLRGAVLRLLNDGKKFPKIHNALVVSATADGDVETDFIFIVPRNDNILYVGGFSEPHATDRVRPRDKKIKDFAQKAKDFLQGRLDIEHQDTAYPLAQGLRPARFGDVRCELEPGTSIVHSYGHAGSGWSLSFGCALEVKVLVEEALRRTPHKSRAQSPASIVVSLADKL